MIVKKAFTCSLLGWCLAVSPGHAVPPMVTDDVPPAEMGVIQWYWSTQYLSANELVQRIPLGTAMSIGITERQEISWGIPWESQDGEHGLGDLFIGTKYLLFKEGDTGPLASLSFNLTTPTGSESRGLGLGEWQYDFRFQVQKKWGWFTLIGNIGYTILPKSDKNVWFLSTAQEYDVSPTTKLVSEVYVQTGAQAGLPSMVAGGVGFIHNLRDNFAIQAEVGTSLREGHQGGPELRVYVGLEWDLSAPWKKPDKTEAAK
jgi:hypothetical protein